MASFLILASLAAGMVASPVPAHAGDINPAPLVLVQNNGQGDCSAAAARAVAETGGQLLSVRASGGVCVITVLVPGNGNERPRKVTIQVRQ
ncbi:MAG: hypothetical protein WC048_12270 [Rhizobium sp.]